MSHPTTVAADHLDRVIESLLLGRTMAQGRRTLGVEYEQLVLHRETRASAPLGFCRDLLEGLARELGGEPVLDGDVVKGVHAAGLELSMEPGGQLEIASPPYANLAETDATVRRVSRVVSDVLDRTEFELQSLGHAPVTPVSAIEMLPRPRYAIMSQRMPARGALTRNMMRATAGFQLTYDIADAQDAGRKMALLYRLSPVLMAVTANSRMVEGRDSGYASFRHRVWLDTDSDRSGVPEGCLHAETAVRGYVEFAKRARMLFFERDGGIVPAPDRPLGELAAEGVVTEADVALHLSALFPFVRLRNYIEIRCFDSVPWPLARSVLAMVSGIVYCDHAFAAAEELSELLVLDDPVELRDFHMAAARSGLCAEVPAGGGKTLRDLAGSLVGFSAATLGGPSCDWARPEDLDAVRKRIDAAVRDQ